MKLIDYLQILTWNTFEVYPPQGMSIYIHCSSKDGKNHKYIKTQKFNAVSFNPQKLVGSSPVHKWEFTWLSAEKIEKDFARL